MKGLNNSERKKTIRNHPFIHTTIIISITNIMVGKKICASDVDWMITSLQNFQNRTHRKIRFTGTQKSLKLARID